MGVLKRLRDKIEQLAKENGIENLERLELRLNPDRLRSYLDLSCNLPLIAAKPAGKNPRELAVEAAAAIADEEYVSHVEVAGPGFLNIEIEKSFLAAEAAAFASGNLQAQLWDLSLPRRSFLIEFVSANPTGPLHLGHGRNGIIGDTLARVLSFSGNRVFREFYVNDHGEQVKKLVNSIRVRARQLLGEDVELPEDAYHGEYVKEIARELLEKFGKDVVLGDEHYATIRKAALEYNLREIKGALDAYGIRFDRFFSEEEDLYAEGKVDKAIEFLKEHKKTYERGGALWLATSEYGDDKDRVLIKKNGTKTYFASDIAYHDDKARRGFDVLIDILGQDHHGYVARLKAAMSALGHDPKMLRVILYQLVVIKRGGKVARLSKRAGRIEGLADVIDAVGRDVARFLYLHKKPDSHLELDLDVAEKRTEENPVFYIQYAYARTRNLFRKAAGVSPLADIGEQLVEKNFFDKPEKAAEDIRNLGDEERKLLLQALNLGHVISVIEKTLEPHHIALYSFEMAKLLHAYYASNRIVDSENIERSRMRLAVLGVIEKALEIGLDLMGLGKPERM